MPSRSSSAAIDRPIVLVGMMGAGKSAVGVALAERLGMAFADLDAWVEAQAGQSVQQLFAARDEAKFRALERAGVLELTARPCVIATGGGAVTWPGSLSRMLEAGRVVYLRAQVETLVARLGAPAIATRPLLQTGEPTQVLARLLDERRSAYERAPVVIDTDHRSIDEVVDALVAVLEPRVVPVPVPAHEGGAYDALVVSDDRDGHVLRAHTQWAAGRKRFLLADADVAARYGARVRAALGECEVVTTTPGEACKTLTEVERVAGELVARGIDRGAVLFALGGGALGDLAGFVAATLLRGVDYVHLPTTLMAMVDSSIGGKTAVNLPVGKNLVGAFHQPRLVVSDLSTLATLASRDRTAGLGEVLKHALLEGEAQLAAIERDAEVLFRGPTDALLDVVAAAIAFKARVVAADPREKQRAPAGEIARGRITLNLGHTIAHGLETASHHARAPLRHGEAVLLGLHAEAVVGARLGLWPDGPARLAGLLPRLGLETKSTEAADALRRDPRVRDVVKTAMSADKKKETGGLRFVLLSDGPGTCREVLLDAERALEIWLGENVG